MNQNRHARSTISVPRASRSGSNFSSRSRIDASTAGSVSPSTRSHTKKDRLPPEYTYLLAPYEVTLEGGHSEFSYINSLPSTSFVYSSSPITVNEFIPPSPSLRSGSRSRSTSSCRSPSITSHSSHSSTESSRVELLTPPAIEVYYSPEEGGEVFLLPSYSKSQVPVEGGRKGEIKALWRSLVTWSSNTTQYNM